MAGEPALMEYECVHGRVRDQEHNGGNTGKNYDLPPIFHRSP
jgi:hypothetical protein